MASMPAGFTSERFVGRESAFGRLAPALEAATAGTSTTVLVEGSGGVGVSRFLAEVTSRLTALADPFTVLHGRSVPAGTDEPYAPVLQALRPILAAVPDDELVELLGPSVEDHLRLMPELHGRLAKPERCRSDQRHLGRTSPGPAAEGISACLAGSALAIR